jgi:hypothetical protein
MKARDVEDAAPRRCGQEATRDAYENDARPARRSWGGVYRPVGIVDRASPTDGSRERMDALSVPGEPFWGVVRGVSL